MPIKLSLVANPAPPRKPQQVIECVCGSRDLLEVRTGARRENGKVTGGTKQWLCANCFAHGKRVVLAT